MPACTVSPIGRSQSTRHITYSARVRFQIKQKLLLAIFSTVHSPHEFLNLSAYKMITYCSVSGMNRTGLRMKEIKLGIAAQTWI